MVMTTASGNAVLSAEEVHELLVLPVLSGAIASTVATVVTTSAPLWRIPRAVGDPAASWTPEGSEIAPSDAQVDEVTVVPSKLAALSVVTRELIDDSGGQAEDLVGAGMVRDLVRRLDQAWVGAVAGAPAGLASLDPDNTVVAAAELTNLDDFAYATSLVAELGASTTAWVTSPAVALKLATLKASDGDNTPLLATDPTAPARPIVQGLPVFTSPDVAPNTVYGVDGSRAYVILRDDAAVESDSSVYFSSDRIALRGTLRVGFAWPHPESVVRIDLPEPAA